MNNRNERRTCVEIDWDSYIDAMHCGCDPGQLELFPRRQVPFQEVEDRVLRYPPRAAAGPPDLDDRTLQFDLDNVLDFVNAVRVARGRDRLAALKLWGAIPADSERCLLARAMDCDVPLSQGVLVESLDVADEVRAATGERGDFDLVSLPEDAMALALRFDAGGITASDLAVERPGQLCLFTGASGSADFPSAHPSDRAVAMA